MKHIHTLCIPAAFLMFAGHASAQDAPWQAAEAQTLRNQTQLTFPDTFAKAGEAYFSPDAKWVIFQAVPVEDDGSVVEADYQMYVAPVQFDDDNAITGLGEAILLSAPGSANTCGFFHPLSPHRVMFGSTLVRPSNDNRPGYQRGESRYSWVFPTEMDIVSMSVPAMWHSTHPDGPAPGWDEAALQPTPMWSTPGYDAECAYSPDAKFIVFTHVDVETQNADLYIRDTTTNEHWPIVQAPGYDGGPFFSPDGMRIVYRSDRAGNDLLQVYVADLEFDEQGRPVGISQEHTITNNEHVNWGPYIHPSGKFLVYATSEVSHRNYEIFSREIPSIGSAVDSASLASKRITHAEGFDGLPAFSPDGKWMMWTSQRGGTEAGQDHPSSQIWVAKIGEISP